MFHKKKCKLTSNIVSVQDDKAKSKKKTPFALPLYDKEYKLIL